MTKTILMGVSLLAIMAAFPAFAETSTNANAQATVKAESTLGEKAEKALDKAGAKIESAADTAGTKIDNAAVKTKDAAKEAYSDVKAYFNDDDDIKVTSSVSVLKKNTADALIGTSVQDVSGKTIGKIHDIIIDDEGDAEWVILEDSGVLGLGTKLAAFDYDVIEGYNKDRDVVVKLTAPQIKSAKAFDYVAKANVTTIPAGKYSVAKLLDATVVGPDGKKVADVDTIAFEGDDAEYVIVTFNQILGLGGEKAALNIDALDIATDAKGNHSFKLNSQQTAQFESYKGAPKAN